MECLGCIERNGKLSELSDGLYRLMIAKGYPPEFTDIVCSQLNTDFTAKRMIGFLSHFGRPSLESVADEMIAILEFRETIVEKKINENSNMKWNRFLRTGIENDD